MFVNTLKNHVIKGVSVLSLLAFSVVGATATEAPSWKSGEGTIPVNITLDEIKSTDGPIYVSIQKRAEYMGMKGHGGIIQTATLGEMSTTFKVDAAGDYSVSVWHDINDDGIFSMDENYKVLDGWGNSAAKEVEGRPQFDDVKVTVPSYGANVTVKMKYPQ